VLPPRATKGLHYPFDKANNLTCVCNGWKADISVTSAFVWSADPWHEAPGLTAGLGTTPLARPGSQRVPIQHGLRGSSYRSVASDSSDPLLGKQHRIGVGFGSQSDINEAARRPWPDRFVRVCCPGQGRSLHAEIIKRGLE